MIFSRQMWYNRYIQYGADTAFDRRTLTGYFANRFCTSSIFLIANTFASVAAKVKSAFSVPSLAVAPIAA